MKREDLTEKLLDIKREKGWTWKHIQEEIGGLSPILITAACLGQMKLPKAQAAKAAALFGLSQSEERLLNEAPYRGSFTAPPTDPLIYRFYELVMVYGTTWKELIQEDFGDGIMSAIDFNMEIEREPNNKGDRVKMTMSGKFLPYKYYGAEDGVPEYGFKGKAEIGTGPMRAGNLFESLPDVSCGEAFETLVAAPGLRIERIVSGGQASPPGFWYDQPQDEWVLVLAGSAEITIAGEAGPRRLRAGDHLLIPAHTRHRVERTDDPTIWLAVHAGPAV